MDDLRKGEGAGEFAGWPWIFHNTTVQKMS